MHRAIAGRASGLLGHGPSRYRALPCDSPAAGSGLGPRSGNLSLPYSEGVIVELSATPASGDAIGGTMGTAR